MIWNANANAWKTFFLTNFDSWPLCLKTQGKNISTLPEPQQRMLASMKQNMNLIEIEMRTNEAPRDEMMGDDGWYTVVLYCSWTVPEGIHHLWLYELLYKFVQEFLPRVDKTKLGSRGDTVRYLKHIDTIGIAWHTFSICDLLGGTSCDWDKYLSWREIKEEEAGRNMIRPPSDFSYFQLYCQNMCGPANAHCLSMFCQGCILMYFTSDQRNFLEFGNVCPNQNFVYCDKP